VSTRRAHRVLQAACVFALIAIGLMTWSILDPRPVPVMVAMSLGQVVGTLALATFGLVIWADLRRGQRALEQIPPSSRRPPGDLLLADG